MVYNKIAPVVEAAYGDGIPIHDKPQSELGRMVRIQESIDENLGIIGPRHLITTTCASGNHAISCAADLLKMAEADMMIAMTGATGAIYFMCTLRVLLMDRHRVDLLISNYGNFTLKEETDFGEFKGSFAEYFFHKYGDEVKRGELVQHNYKELQGLINSPGQRFRHWRWHGYRTMHDGNVGRGRTRLVQ